MNVYIFSSTSLENIRRGIENCLWAVPPMEEPHAASRRTRAADMRPGSAGLFYCSDPQVFTTPFIIESSAENRSVSDVWEHTWHLPFKIRPLGELRNRVTWHHATAAWRFVRDADNRGGLVTAARAFAPENLLRHEWDEMLKELGLNPEEYEDIF